MADENLLNIVTRARIGEYYLPEIQRGFIWRPEQVRRLCDSLCEGYPVGVLLLWNNRDYTQPQRGAPNHVRQPLWIIDGQQRITSLCLLFGEKPYWYGPDEWTDLRKKYRVFANINSKTGDAQFSGRSGIEDAKSVLVPEVLSKKEEGEIVDLAREISGGDDRISQLVLRPLLRLWNIRNAQQVPVIQIMGKEPEEVAEIFDRLNRGGTRIKETDTRFALIAGYNPGWRRDEFDPFLNELEERGWDIPPGYLLQAMTVFHLGKARMSEVDGSFWRQEVQAVWRSFKEAIDEVITFLWDRGIPAIDLVPSEYTLIPLLGMHAKFRRTQGYSFDAAYHWFLKANMEGRYSGAPLEILTRDASQIKGSQTLEEALTKMPLERKIAMDDLTSFFHEPFRRGEFTSLLIHLLLWQRDARDWLQPLTLRAAGTNNGLLRPHWHHIVPRAWAKRSDFLDADCVANVTILTESTNVRRLGARPPWDYVHRNNISQQALEEHLVPEEFARKFVNGEPLTKEEFADFLLGRANLLAMAVTKYLGLEEEVKDAC
jgi:hypothetical protein